MDLKEHPPWSKKKIDRMGKAIRDGQAHDEELYTDFLIWSGHIIGEAQKLIATTLKISDRQEITIPTEGIRVIERVSVKLTGRPKTLDTTREKLRRMPDFKLSRIQDICGLRLDGEFSLDQQDYIAGQLEETFSRAGAQKIERNDLRESARQGYRAVHLNANFPAGRIELQIRTKLQSAWANVFELLADVYGREIRYTLPTQEALKKTVLNFQSISDSAYGIDDAIRGINRSAIEVKENFPDVQETDGVPSAVRGEFARILGERALAIGSQINVVDILDRERDHLIAERAEKYEGR